MNRFFYVVEDTEPPAAFAHLFPELDEPEKYERVTTGFFFSHRFAKGVLGNDEDLATLSFSRIGYQGSKPHANASIIYQVFTTNDEYYLEQELSYEMPVKKRSAIFRSEDTDLIAAFEAKMNAEIVAEREARDTERALGLRAVEYTVAEDLIAFAKAHNPFHQRHAHE